jgi:hypothetical protein
MMPRVPLLLLAAAAPLCAAVQTSFEEESLSPLVLLDIPNPSLGNVSFDAANDELDFTAGGNTDMWASRNNAAIAWTAIPEGLVPGSTWTVETEVRLNNVAQNNQVAGLTFYGGPNGARPDITFGLDNWDPAARAVRLQGLGDNVPNTAIATTAGKVILRVDITEGGATDTYNFYFRTTPAEPWQQIPGAAGNYQTNFPNARVGLTYKTAAAKAGASFSYFNVYDTSKQPPVINGQPADATALVGGVARFSVAASGGGSFQWRRNGVAISPGGEGDALVIDPVSEADSGVSYDCVVTNANGSTTSRAALLTVLASPPAGHGYYASAVQAEPSLFAYFPVDGSVSPAVRNVRRPSFSGTLNGDAAHDSTGGRVIGVKGLRSAGSGWVTINKDPEWDFPDGEGTIEMWVYQTTAAAYNPCLIAVRNDAAGGTRFSLHADTAGSRIWFFNGSGAPTWTLPVSSIGRLMHLAIVMKAGQAELFHNGQSLGTVSQTLGGGLGLPAIIGAAGPSTQESFPGHIDEIALYAEALPASALAAHYDASQNAAAGSAPAVAAQPSSAAVNEGGSVTFQLALSNPGGASYRWVRNGIDIPGATEPSYTLAAASLADDGATFQCVVYNGFGGSLSNPATLRVIDTNPPVLQSASAPVSADQVIVTFNEPVDLTGAEFRIGGGTVTAAVAGPLPGMVTLTVNGLTPATDYRLTVIGIRDLTGNVMTNAEAGFTAAPPPVPAPIGLVRPDPEPAGPATRRGPFTLAEIHYHPRSRTDGRNLEFVELFNSQPWAEDVSGFRLSGEVEFAFPQGTTIPAGGRLVIAAVPADLQAVYGLANVLGPWQGALNNAGGTLRLIDISKAVVFEVDYDSGHPWQPAADGAGHSLVLARPSYGMNDPQAWDAGAAVDGSPGSPEPSPANPWRSILINEVSSAGPGPDFIELCNRGSEPVGLSGCVLSDDRTAAKYTFAADVTLNAGATLALDSSQLGFGLKAGGDTVYFRAPGVAGETGRVLDCLRFGAQDAGTSVGRHPDGAPVFATLSEPSAGKANARPATPTAVISEIFYKAPAGSAQAPFVEITNISPTALDLSGWRIRGGISYDHPASAPPLAPGASIAITAFSGRLNSGTGERLRLERPVAILDGAFPLTEYVVADEVTYGTGGQWGRDSDGGGSSLEKTDLRADGRLAASWADSQTPDRKDWVTIEATGVLDNGSGSAIDRVHIMMLGAGECLIDSVEVTQNNGPNRVTNAGFEEGTTGWLIQGTHDASTIATPGWNSAQCLHVRAAGRGDLAGNRLSVPLTTTLAPNSTATIRARVKWLRGQPEILLRLAGGVLEATGSILPPGWFAGTPGQPNSTRRTNAGPSISHVTHLPILPAAAEPVTVYARLADPDGISLALLRYRLDPATQQNTVVMDYRGGGLFSAEIPAQSAGTLAAFTVTAYDPAGASREFPGGRGEALVRWGDPAPAGNLGVYRFWMTEATRNAWTSRIKNSNTPLDVTFVPGPQRVIYHASAQYSGSPWHTSGFNGPQGNPCDYDCNVPSDDRYLGETDFILAGPGTFGDDTSLIREQTIWWIARRIGLPSIHRRFCRVVINGSQRQTVFEDTQQPSGAWIDAYWPDDDDGMLHKAQDWIEYADNGTTFGTTLRAFLARRTTTGGVHKDASYRYQWALRSTDSGNDWTEFRRLVDAFNTGSNGSDPAFFNAVDPLVDEDSWARALAIQRIAGNWDTWGYTYGKNMYLYKPRRGPWAMTAWDIDFSFGLVGDAATTGLEVNTQDPLCTKFRTNPTFRRAWWAAFRDAVDGPMVTATVNARIDAMVAGLAASSVTANAGQVSTVKSYVSSRRSYIISQLNAAYPGTTFAISGSNALTDDDGAITLTGTAPPGVRFIRINGIDYTPSWISQTGWRLNLNLYAASNELTVQGIDRRGAVAGSFPLTVTVTGPPVLPAVTINEWMAGNSPASGITDPADGRSDDWFELHNAGTGAVDLSGFFLSDDPSLPGRFAIPAGTVIPPGGHLLVWADGEPGQNGITPGQLHVPFRLSATGEQILLSAPDGRAVNAVSFGTLADDAAEGRFPDGSAGQSLLTIPSPASPNVFLSTAGAAWSAAGYTVTITSTPGRKYQLQFSEGLVNWSPKGDPVVATAPSLTLTDPAAGAPARGFYRVALLP